MLSQTLGLLPLVLSLFTSLKPAAASTQVYGKSHPAHHRAVAKRKRADLVPVGQTYYNSRWTWYNSDEGIGACGQWTPAADFVVALNQPQFGEGYPAANCFKTITMNYNGKIATAKIVDECPECPYGALDLSRSLFRYFAPEDVGVIYGSWYLNQPSQAPLISMGFVQPKPALALPKAAAQPKNVPKNNGVTTVKAKPNSPSEYCKLKKRSFVARQANEVSTDFGPIVVQAAHSSSNSNGTQSEGH